MGPRIEIRQIENGWLADMTEPYVYGSGRTACLWANTREKAFALACETLDDWAAHPVCH